MIMDDTRDKQVPILPVLYMQLQIIGGTEQHVPHQYSQCFDLISGSDDHGRYKRQTGSNTACAVYAIADYRYFQHMGQSNMFPISTLSALI